MRKLRKKTFKASRKQNTGFDAYLLIAVLSRVNQVYGTDQINSQWYPAQYKKDPRGGWMVTIEPK